MGEDLDKIPGILLLAFLQFVPRETFHKDNCTLDKRKQSDLLRAFGYWFSSIADY